jgi:glycosyl hydrolase family 26
VAVRSRRTRCIVVAVAAIICSTIVMAATASPSRDALGTQPGVLLGAYVNPTETWLGLADDQRKVREFEALIGRPLAIDMHYHGWRTAWPTDLEAWDAASGRIPMVTWGSPSSGPTLAALTSGSEDGWLRQRARAAKALGSEIFLRPLWEMNGNWSAWDGAHNGNSPPAFVGAWSRIHDIFRQEGADNVVWVWSPNAVDTPAEQWNHWTRYYPGDDYVDWVGMDGYNWGHADDSHTWQPFGAVFRDLYADYAGRKPLMIAETASTEVGGDKAAWIADARATLKSSFPAVRAVIWFHANKETDWRVDSSRQALLAFRAFARDDYFGQATGAGARARLLR